MSGLIRTVAIGRSWLARAAMLGLDFALPPRCLTCDAAVEAPGRLCTACFRATGFVTEPCCDRCGTPFRHAGQGGLTRQCVQCTDDPPPWSRGRAALRYDDQARRIILPLKHADRVDVAPALGRHMARVGAALLQSADLLVPVPLHRRRLLARRYNQSALLAQVIGRVAGRPVVPDALRRVRPTASLGEKTRRERAEAVEGAFAVRPTRAADIAGRRVLLIDDVLTTGATAGACTRALLAGGAARVELLVGARATLPDEGLS
jgi:ComF family protein